MTDQVMAGLDSTWALGSEEAEERPDLAGSDARAVFARVFDRHARALHGYLARRVGAHVAEDLVAETFLTAWAQRARYDPARAVIRVWLYGIATNLLRRHVRQEVRALRAVALAEGQIVQEQCEAHDGRVAERVDAEVRVRRLARDVAELAAGDRDVLLLTSWAGLDSIEVAEVLGIPVGTVRSRLHRVRRRLRCGLRTEGME